MPPPPHTKPENVLKRAQELIAVGQSPAALTILHEHVTSKRTRNSPISSLEPVMLLFVELCVELRKGKSAKDGLYQYKNIAQNTNVGTIEMVLKKFIELAEQKVTEAQAKADEVQSTLESAAPAANVEDLEAIETPETILLATVSGEQSRDRTDRAIVTPWLKFLWETYRTVLEILKNNARLEILYASTALQAFQFCLKYARKTEFRRLCELLRNHVANAIKYANQMHAINLNDPDTLKRHLDLRFHQLNAAVDLELWQEAFRSVEDIHTLLSSSKRPAQNIMMANYYEKLTKIFLVSENYLFHAAAWSRYYNILRQSSAMLAAGHGSKKENPAVSEADMTKAASFVLLSALSIPVISTSRSRGTLVDVDEIRKNKNTRLTNLLGMQQAPTRAGLFKDAAGKGLLKRARPEIRDLFNILEVDFHPLSICRKISPILTQIGADEEMKKYVKPLQQVILTRLFQQLSQVYESVELKFVYDLAQFPEPFQVDSSTIEKFIMNGCKKGDLAIRVNHASGILTFDSDVFSAAKALHPGSAAGSAESETGTVQRLQSTPAEIVRSQLTRLAKTLYITCQYVDPSFNESRQQAKIAAFTRAEAGASTEHEETLARRAIIEKKKEAASDALKRKQQDEETKKRLRIQQQQEAEAKRLREEQQEREKKRLKQEQERIRQIEIEKQIKELKTGVKNIDIEIDDMENLDTNRLRAIKLAQLEKEKNELSDRVRITGKRIDHLERAYRREELKHFPTDYEAQKKADREIFEKDKNQRLQEAEQKHKEDVALKHRLSRLVPAYEKFRKDIEHQRKEEYDKRRRNAERELQAKMKQRRKEYIEKKHRERIEQEEAERRQREEEEERQREEEERAAKEEAEKEARAKRAAERAKTAEEARLRLMKEDEAAARHSVLKARAPERTPERAPERTPERASERATPEHTIPERAVPDRVIERTGSSEGRTGPPRLFGGKAGGWRERLAQKEKDGKEGGNGASLTPPAANGTPDEEPAPAPAPLKRTGYIPPALRNRTAGASSPPIRSHTPDRRETDSPSPASGQASAPTKGKWVPPHRR
ncbi:MAG: eukaryotic translation initiation factor 3 subunit A [Cirrosporium novae-zelandiae]|nr:MAG: eukaryotic translation initiation factor 3 subunit A [Cirrosporium novae-zelandiae]